MWGEGPTSASMHLLVIAQRWLMSMHDNLMQNVFCQLTNTKVAMFGVTEHQFMEWESSTQISLDCFSMTSAIG